jgi:hypothetical protein
MILSTWKSLPWKSYFYCMTKKEEVMCFSETLIITNLTGGCNQMIRMNMDCHEQPNFHSFWTSVRKLQSANCLSGMLLSNTQFSSDLHTPTANLTTFQKGPFYFGIKVFNHLPSSIKKTSHDINHFRSILKSFLIINSFYSEEYLLGIPIKILA